MKYEEMYLRLRKFKEYIDNLEDNKQKRILLKFFTGYDETLKEYNFEKLRKLYH